MNPAQTRKYVVPLIAGSLIVSSCGRDTGRGANSPSDSTKLGEKGVSNGVSALGAPLGPLGATSTTPNTVTTGTTADVLINTTSGHPVHPAPQAPAK